jgi:molecular chaperone DnaJ
MITKSPYEVLGIDKAATDKEIKTAFHKLALEFHPDKNKDAGAEDRFKEISAAYDTLSDPQKRQQYDQFGSVSPSSNQSYPQGFDINEIFKGGFGFNFDDFFGGGRKRNQRSVFQGSDIHKQIAVDFMAAVQGSKKTIKVSYAIECNDCKGTGAEDGIKFSSCNTCDGTGKTSTTQGYMRIMSTCRSCGGSGRHIEVKCHGCVGSGQRLKEEKLSINVPAGIDEGTTMRLAGKGMPGLNGGPNGDLYVGISITPHPKFNRRGLDIYVDEDIDYLDALLGAEREIDTVHGKGKLTIPPLTQPGMVLRLDGRGINTDQNTGHHYIRANVKLPDKLNDEEKELLHKLKGMRG